jgi:hypothetical protein
VDHISVLSEEIVAPAVPVVSRTGSLSSVRSSVQEKSLLKASLGASACSALGFGALLLSPLVLLFVLGRETTSLLYDGDAALYVGLPLIAGSLGLGCGCAGLACCLNKRAQKCADAYSKRYPFGDSGGRFETMPLQTVTSSGADQQVNRSPI